MPKPGFDKKEHIRKKQDRLRGRGVAPPKTERDIARESKKRLSAKEARELYNANS